MKNQEKQKKEEKQILAFCVGPSIYNHKISLSIPDLSGLNVTHWKAVPILFPPFVILGIDSEA